MTYFGLAYPALFKNHGGTSYIVTKIVLCWCYAAMVGATAWEAIPSTYVWYATLRDLAPIVPYTRPTAREVADGDNFLIF